MTIPPEGNPQSSALWWLWPPAQHYHCASAGLSVTEETNLPQNPFPGSPSLVKWTSALVKTTVRGKVGASSQTVQLFKGIEMSGTLL